MASDSVAARRILFRGGSSTFGRRPARAVVISLVTTVAALLVTPAPADAAPEPGTVTVEVAPTNSSVLRPGQDLSLTVSVANSTDAPVADAALDLHLADRALASRAAVTDWLHPEQAGEYDSSLHRQILSEPIEPGDSVTLVITVPAAVLPLGEASPWGPRGIAVTVDANEGIEAEGRSAVVWYTGSAVSPVNLSLLMPVTTPAGSEGLIGPEELETYTQPSGLLTRQLEGVVGRPVAIGIDPMIIASIRILGSSAPASAVAWLNRLAGATNDIFPLSYGDADAALQAQAGVDTLLEPTTFDPLIDPALFTGGPAAGAQEATDDRVPDVTAGPNGSPDATASPTPSEPAPPTSDELVEWDYTSTAIGWPADDTVSPPDLSVFAASGLTSVILSESNLQRDGGTVAGVVDLGEIRGIVSDDALSGTLRRAISASSEIEWRAAMAEAGAHLAAASREQPQAGLGVLATFARGWPSTAARMSQTIDDLASLPWHSPATLSQALETSPANGVSVADRAEDASRVELARRLLAREAEVSEFSSALADPAELTAPRRLDRLALFATSWTGQPDSWREAVADDLTASRQILGSVQVTTQGPINVVGSQVDIPVTLSNSLDQPLTVRVRVVPSNGRLVVGGDVESTIDAQSATTVKVPVTAAVGNGDVSLRVTLTTPTGVPIGDPAQIPVNVRADWEGLGALAFAILVVLFFGFGVWRNIVRRRRERMAAGVTPPTSPGAPGASAAPGEDTVSDPHGR